ncbi:GATA transcription factor 4-like [Hibiscus syriacus]|uniref:GATA transcription factor 4-like n=1 Tax=Hibiscus syriacus TaxID=106335 RepID=UPI001924313F|nr:GATA transcription factor 4-like [Hibiscus syriacus]
MGVEEISAYDNIKNRSLPSPIIGEERSDWETPLCVPQDSLEDIDWFPNFSDQTISLDGFLQTLDEECFVLEIPAEMTAKLDETIAFANRKQRSKREGKRGYWIAKQKQISGNESQVFDNIAERDSDARRKCSHCLVESTPQWRMGPLGPKTLCNACGVRYKSGRLVPEYRPAASPTFDVAKHSNFHKQILRRRDFGA